MTVDMSNRATVTLICHIIGPLARSVTSDVDFDAAYIRRMNKTLRIQRQVYNTCLLRTPHFHHYEKNKKKEQEGD